MDEHGLPESTLPVCSNQPLAPPLMYFASISHRTWGEESRSSSCLTFVPIPYMNIELISPYFKADMDWMHEGGEITKKAQRLSWTPLYLTSDSDAHLIIHY